ncbi:MAG: HlyD family efflux transporter periplasmic adaptor subunit [Rikenellaceae bacterium]
MDKKKIIVALTVVAIVVVSVFVMVTLIKTKPESKKMPNRVSIIGVKTDKVALGDYTIEVKYPGRVTPRELVTLSSEVSGRLLSTRRPLKVGQNFRKGDLLVDIFDDDVKAAHTAQVSAFLSTLANALPDIKLDMAEEFEKWNSFFTLVDVNGKLPKLPKLNSDKEKVYLSAKGILTSYYNLVNSEINLGRYQIVAPFNGVYTSVSKEVGAVTTVNGEIAHIASTDALELVVGVPLESAQLLELGTSIDVVSGSGKIYKGRIDRIAPYVDSSTQRVNLYITFVDPSMDIIGGQLLNVTLPSKELQSVQAVLREAVIDNSLVYVVKDDKLQSHNIEVIASTNTHVYVKGLSDGEVLVMESLVSPYNGMEVRTLDMQGTQIGGAVQSGVAGVKGADDAKGGKPEGDNAKE